MLEKMGCLTFVKQAPYTYLNLSDVSTCLKSVEGFFLFLTQEWRLGLPQRRLYALDKVMFSKSVNFRWYSVFHRKFYRPVCDLWLFVGDMFSVYKLDIWWKQLANEGGGLYWWLLLTVFVSVCVCGIGERIEFTNSSTFFDFSVFPHYKSVAIWWFFDMGWEIDIFQVQCVCNGFEWWFEDGILVVLWKTSRFFTTNAALIYRDDI